MKDTMDELKNAANGFTARGFLKLVMPHLYIRDEESK